MSRMSRTEFELKLYENYRWFAGLNPNNEDGWFQFGLEIGEGWEPLIQIFCDRLQQMEVPDDYQITCVKQKFGDLVIYDENPTKQIRDLRNMITTKAEYVCEDCGSEDDVKKTDNGWIETLCKRCQIPIKDRK